MSLVVMILDDSAVMRKIVTRALRMALPHIGEVLEGASGLDGVQMLQSGARPHLIFTDVNMPGMDGIAFVKKARQYVSSNQTKILMITTESGQEKILAATEAGADGYITKPFTPDQIAARLDGLKVG